MTSPAATVSRFVPLGAQMSVLITQNGQRATCVMGARVEGGNVNLAEAQGWFAAWVAAFKPVLGSDSTIAGAVVRGLQDASPPIFELGAPASPAGGNAGGGLAAGCVLVKWGTGFGGRTARGRTYLPGVSHINMTADGRSYTANMATTVNTAIAAYLGHANFSATTIRPAVISFKDGLARPITVGSLAPVVGVQRRRMRA